MEKGHTIIAVTLVVMVFGAYYGFSNKSTFSLSEEELNNIELQYLVDELPGNTYLENKVVFGGVEYDKNEATHIEPPEVVKAIYMTSWVAGTPILRNRVVKLIEETEVNALVIDVKDYTGKIAFDVDDYYFEEMGSIDRRVGDIKEFIQSLHEKDIYVIGRVAVFQDPHLVKLWPEKSVQSISNPGEPWKDRKGISWMDPGSKDVWDYHVRLAKAVYEIGIDEINFDYIRFPSDGDMSDVKYTSSEGRAKQDVLEEFFAYLDQKLRKEDSIPISADIFGMTTTNRDDLNIGQVLEKTLPYFDYVCPMVYPSHYPPTWNGYQNPAEKPYEVIEHSMRRAVERAVAMGEDPDKLRPWLQDFNLGATYTEDMVKSQIQATYDVGLDSWLMWDPKNIYTKGAFELVYAE